MTGSPPPSASNAGSATAAERRGPGVGLLWWVAWRDVFAPRSRRETATAVALVALCVTLVATPLGLSLASQRADDLALKKKPLCIWAGDPTVKDQLNPRRLEALDAELARRLGTAADRVRRVPFHEMTYEWFEDEVRKRSVPFAGRTIAADDPLWDKVTLVEGAPLRGPEPAVAVSREMLRRLAPEGADVLRLRHPTTKKAVTVAVGAVLADEEFPSGHDFAFTEEFARRLTDEEPDVPYRRVFTGPAHGSWQDVAALPGPARDSLRRTFETYKVRWPPLVEERLDHTAWQLEAAAEVEPPLLSEWKESLQAIARDLKRNRLTVPERFADPTPPRGERQAAARLAPQRLALYVEQRGLLREVGAAAGAAGLPVYDVVVAQMDDVERNARVWFWVNAGVSLGVGLVACWIVFLALRNRVRQQAKPIGMLRAMGAGSGQVLGIYLLVGLALWLAGLALGGVLAAALSVVTAGLLGLGTAAWAAPAWSWPWWLVACFVVASGLICVVSTLLATLGVIRASPIELLRDERG